MTTTILLTLMLCWAAPAGAEAGGPAFEIKPAAISIQRSAVSSQHSAVGG